jgi:uncharacterized protein YecT (DUF1311 family)
MQAGFAYANTDCGVKTNPDHYRRCVERNASASSSYLRQTLGLLLHHINVGDKKHTERQQAVSLLQQSFAAFEDFRRIHCTYEVSMAVHRNDTEELIRLRCESSLNYKYAKLLLEHLS